MQNGEYFFGEKHGKIAHGINFTPKIILRSEEEYSEGEMSCVVLSEILYIIW